MSSKSLARINQMDKVVLAPIQLESEVIGVLSVDKGGVPLPGNDGQVLTLISGEPGWSGAGIASNASIVDQVIS